MNPHENPGPVAAGFAETMAAREEATLSPLAARSWPARRERAEADCTVRSPLQRDRDRIVHSKAFRRLKHKTQVFVSPEGDHYRTRLTHTIEVTQIARTVARALRLNEDLTEAIGLGHDLGHPPFGHNGEEALESLRSGTFDAVLMDVQMPGMDGHQATALIRAQPHLRELPVIAMTAHALVRDRARCLASGMSDYIAKPFNPAELFSVLERWTSTGTPAPAGPEALAHGLAPTPASALPHGVSIDEGLQRCLGRTDLYDRIVSRFLASRLQDPQQLRAALAQGNTTGIAAIAHTAVATAGTLGAAHLSEVASLLQNAALDGGTPSQLSGLIDAFEQAHQHVILDLKAHQAQRIDVNALSI